MADDLPFTPALRVGEVLYCSGQIGLGPEGVVEGLTAQIRQGFANLGKVLVENGSSLDRVFKTTVFLTDINDYAEMNQAYAECFGPTRPVRSAVAVAALPLGARFEIEAIARVS